jgi:hypothetical protein
MRGGHIGSKTGDGESRGLADKTTKTGSSREGQTKYLIVGGYII